MYNQTFPLIDKFGTKFWRNKEGELHRLDGPAVEYSDGDKYWYNNGVYHRLGGPAQELVSGNKIWYQYGKLHRLDGPAIEFSNGMKEWYQIGLRHRIDGPAYIDKIRGVKSWYIEGIVFKNKDTFFEALTKKEKELALFSEDFLNG